jgi:uncharacterized membrane protein YesL
MKLFAPDSPVINVLTKIADFIIINIYTLLLCIPVVTAGAAITAGYYVMLKIRRDEDSGITKLYFRSFKENFRQATIIWIIMILVIGVPAYLFAAFQANMGDQMPMAVKILLGGAVLFSVFIFSMTFPVLSRFSNTVGGTIKSGIFVAISNPPRSFLMIIMAVAPFYLTYNFLVLLPIVLMFGFSLPAFLSVCLYNKQFLKMEEDSNRRDGILPAGSDDEHIFSDGAE